MADLASLKVGDDLKILVKILYIDDAQVPVKVLCDREEVWLSRQAIEAAEHIPAPRIFRRRDSVRLRQLDGQWMHGGIVVSSPVRVPEKYEVHFSRLGIIAANPDELEPDEAPE